MERSYEQDAKGEDQSLGKDFIIQKQYCTIIIVEKIVERGI